MPPIRLPGGTGVPLIRAPKSTTTEGDPLEAAATGLSFLLLLKFCSCGRERGKTITRTVLFPLTAFSQGSIVPGFFARRTLVKYILA